MRIESSGSKHELAVGQSTSMTGSSSNTSQVDLKPLARNLDISEHQIL